MRSSLQRIETGREELGSMTSSRPPVMAFAWHRNVDEALRATSTDDAGGDQEIPDWTGLWNVDRTSFHLEIPGPIDASRHYLVKYFRVTTRR